MKKVMLTVPWGHIEPAFKDWNKSTVYYNDFFSK
jgi:hypothetical protein